MKVGKEEIMGCLAAVSYTHLVATFAKGEPVTLNENDDNSLLGAFNANVDVPVSYTHL